MSASGPALWTQQRSAILRRLERPRFFLATVRLTGLLEMDAVSSVPVEEHAEHIRAAAAVIANRFMFMADVLIPPISL
ncbi:MAG: hypothetical protein HC841_04095 [Verrucomicrobiae bacterium]|nr:hypothetical protein [Verrucomicrobiae bacterium]